MKKILSLALAILLLTCSVALADGTLTLDALTSKGQLTVATSPDFPPFESLDGSGNVFGIEIDILAKVCEKLGIELGIVQMDFDSVLPGIQAGRFDLGASGITVTESRKQNVLFTEPYCLAAQAIVVTADSEIKGKADLEGKKVSVQTGTTAEEFCMGNGYEVMAFTANNDAQSALMQGKVDAWVIDDLTAAEMVALYNSINPGALVILDEAMTTEPYAFAFALGNDEVVSKVNEILGEMLADGTIEAIFASYEAPYTAPDTIVEEATDAAAEAAPAA